MTYPNIRVVNIRDPFAQPEQRPRDRVYALLEATPNMTSKEISAKLLLSVTAIYGLIGSLIKDKSIHASGEELVNKSYVARYSVGSSGPFALAPERLMKKPKRSYSAEALARRPVVPRVPKAEMIRRTVDALNFIHQCKPQTWLSIISEAKNEPSTIARYTPKKAAAKERRAARAALRVAAPAYIEISPWQVAGRSSLSD